MRVAGQAIRLPWRKRYATGWEIYCTYIENAGCVQSEVYQRRVIYIVYVQRSDKMIRHRAVGVYLRGLLYLLCAEFSVRGFVSSTGREMYK